ncbi:hypothetical protein Pmani_023584 [Petrolisthes manimaculis]|uniref:ETS domain-containing protein n=1 Tax=Petrolisthes manimaculis TaxID=1843537 RepID=A0AAE1U0X9_9EUCA|nr:hypothetical protein Pmani_023584 [Petrolisthes manimaculis]
MVDEYSDIESSLTFEESQELTGGDNIASLCYTYLQNTHQEGGGGMNGLTDNTDTTTYPTYSDSHDSRGRQVHPNRNMCDHQSPTYYTNNNLPHDHHESQLIKVKTDQSGYKCLSSFSTSSTSKLEVQGKDSTVDLGAVSVKDLDRYLPEEETAGPITEQLHHVNLQKIRLEPLEDEASTSAISDPRGLAGPLEKIPTNTRRKERGPKSWEFLMRLLMDPKTNPSLVKWEDEEDGTFRLMQPSMLAKLWGARSDKQYLSYVNFARGIRYHYNSGALQPVSERQLVYRCGPLALQYLHQLKNQNQLRERKEK